MAASKIATCDYSAALCYNHQYMSQKKLLANRRLNNVAEHMVVGVLTKLNMSISIDKTTGLLGANGYSVAVKGSTYSPKGYRFHMDNLKHADFVALVCFTSDYNYSHLYLLPASKARNREAIYLTDGGYNAQRYEEFKNNFAPILTK